MKFIGKFNNCLFCAWGEDKLNSLAEKYEQSLDTTFKPFQPLQNILVKFSNGKNKWLFNNEEESPTKSIGLEENFFETLVLSQ